MKGGTALRECSGGGPHQDGQQSLPGKLVTELRTSKQEGLEGEEGTGSTEAEGLPGQGQKSEVAFYHVDIASFSHCPLKTTMEVLLRFWVPLKFLVISNRN